MESADPRRRTHTGLVIVVHGGDDRSTSVAGRIVLDLGGGGLLAEAIEVDDGTGQRLDEATAVVLVHASGARWPDGLLDGLPALRAVGKVVIVGRSDTSRLPPALHGFPVLSLVPERSYPPDDAEGGGYEHLFDIIAPRMPRPPRPPTAVFLSYSRRDSAFLDGVLIPRLWKDAISYFDFQYTQKLDIAMLESELERWVLASGLLLIVATPHWQKSRWCLSELSSGRRHGKPVVAVWPPGTGPRRAPDCGDDVQVISFSSDTDEVAGGSLTATLARLASSAEPG